MDIRDLVKYFSVNPRKILGIELPPLEEGANACLTVFDPEQEYTFTKDMLKSRSDNCPAVNEKVKGKVLAVFNKNKKYIR